MEDSVEIAQLRAQVESMICQLEELRIKKSQAEQLIVRESPSHHEHAVNARLLEDGPQSQKLSPVTGEQPSKYTSKSKLEDLPTELLDMICGFAGEALHLCYEYNGEACPCIGPHPFHFVSRQFRQVLLEWYKKQTLKISVASWGLGSYLRRNRNNAWCLRKVNKFCIDLTILPSIMQARNLAFLVQRWSVRELPFPQILLCLPGTTLPANMLPRRSQSQLDRFTNRIPLKWRKLYGQEVFEPLVQLAKSKGSNIEYTADIEATNPSPEPTLDTFEQHEALCWACSGGAENVARTIMYEYPIRPDDLVEMYAQMSGNGSLYQLIKSMVHAG